MTNDESAWAHVIAVTQPALQLMSTTYLDEIAARLDEAGVRDAVARRDSGPIYDWLMGLISLQGISDRAAVAFDAKHGGVSFAEVETALASTPSCPRLRSYWHVAGCGYRRSAHQCAEPRHLARCPLPCLPLRKGGLNVASFGLALFIRDVADGDLVGWTDDILQAADPGVHAANRAAAMRTALLEPLVRIPNTGPKLWSMMLAELLLAGDPARERWVTAGASFVAVDSLIHNHLHRTGILRCLRAEHPYGDRCYGPGGCAEVIQRLAERVDAREFNVAFPATFPRFVQSALWLFCAEWGWNVCNGRRIDDRERCGQRTCPTFRPATASRSSQSRRACLQRHR